MQAKELQLYEPIISTYTSYGAIFSMMGEKNVEWVYNNFIQLRYAPVWGTFTFDKHQFLMTNCPALNFYTCPMEILEEKYEGSLFNFIKFAIDLNYYVLIYVDRYYISLYDNYKKSHFPHEIFISGYDLSDRTVTVSDNMNGGIYQTIKCEIREIEEAYEKMDKEILFLSELRMVRYNPEGKENLNIEQIKFELERYLNSTPTYDLVYTQDYVFGWGVYKLILEKIDKWNETSTAYEVRIFHLLYEHKILMERRVQYLENNHYLDKQQGLLQQASVLKQEFLNIRNLVVKRNIMNDKHKGSKLAQKIEDKLIDALKFEREFIKKLIESIKDLEG